MSAWTFAESVALIPAVACALAIIALYRNIPPFRPALPLLLLFALALRWYFMVQFANPSGDIAWDAQSYRIVGGLVRSGRDVYAATNRHPYLPFHMYVVGLSSWLGAHTGPHLFTWVRWPNVLADLGIVAIIYRATIRLGRNESQAFWLAMIWAVHPVSIYTSTIHGQFDSVAIFFALAGWYSLRFTPGTKGVALGGAALGLAIVDKTWPVIFVVPLLLMAPTLRLRLLLLGCAAAVPLVAVGIYASLFGTTLHELDTKVLQYSSVPNRYGFSYASRHYLEAITDGGFGWLEGAGRGIFFVAIAAITAITARRGDPLASCVALIATFLVFTPGFGSQYLVWIIPFAILARQRAMLAVYSAVATASLIAYYFGACGYRCPGWFSNRFAYWEFQWVWAIAIFWFVRETASALVGPSMRSPFGGLAGRRTAAAHRDATI